MRDAACLSSLKEELMTSHSLPLSPDPGMIPPAPGEVREVAEGIFWLRMPLPFRLDHVNIWIVDDGDGWAIVDCGIDDTPSRQIWDSLFAGFLAGRPIRRVIATHGHTDHVGAAALLREKNDATFEASLTEWMAARLRYIDHREHNTAAVEAFLRHHGCDEHVVESLQTERQRVSTHLGRQPDSLERLVGGQKIALGGREWRVISAGGHADEHISLFCEAEHILLAGDHILPRISPLIAVFPAVPKADPLSAYLQSLDTFADLPEETLILPGHGLPFASLHARLDELRLHHDTRLAELYAMLAKPLTAFEAMRKLFPRAAQNDQSRLALGETLAHLHRLLTEGRAHRIEGPDGGITFVAAE